MTERQLVPGRVSVVVVNYRGAADTITCLEQLTQLDYPADHVELICVDNASGDDSVERIRAAMPAGVKLVESPRNTGFTGGCNLGVEHATGEFVAFINNDARPDAKWLADDRLRGQQGARLGRRERRFRGRGADLVRHGLQAGRGGAVRRHARSTGRRTVPHRLGDGGAGERLP
jgi:glycosyltransferase involved in cell wall biosynthesis